MKSPIKATGEIESENRNPRNNNLTSNNNMLYCSCRHTATTQHVQLYIVSQKSTPPRLFVITSPNIDQFLPTAYWSSTVTLVLSCAVSEILQVFC